MNTGHSFSTSDRESVGPFELERSLGRGGMAETFVAVRHGPSGFEQRVCLKRILPELASDPSMVRLFLDEARNTASLRHSNIAQVIEFGTAGGHHYLALELVDGLDLHKLLDALPQGTPGLPPDVVAHIAVELSAALDYAHHAPNLAGHLGIFHRDVSPSNILVSENGDLKLTDFGVAKAAGQARATAAGIVRGKVEYMAPEYGMGGEYDAACDQFSLGVMLFELLAGVRPYRGSSQGEVLHRANQGFHRPLGTFRSDAPPKLVGSIERMICPKPEQRFGSMAEVTQALLDVAPGPRGRAALAQRVVASRNATEPPPSAAPAFDPMAATMLGPQIEVPAAPSSDLPKATSSDRSPAMSTPMPSSRDAQSAISIPGVRSNLRLVIAVATVVALLCFFALLALVDDPKPPVSETPTQAAIERPAPPTPPVAAQVIPSEPEIPLGVEPPPHLDPAPVIEATPREPQRVRPAQPTGAASPPAPAEPPHEIIHRQTNDLLRPKDW